MKLILVTGMSGSGKAVALRTLEDSGFEAIDNIPLSLVASVVSGASAHQLALGVDIRSRDFSAQHFADAVAPFRNDKNIKLKILFLDCDDEELRRRFTTTRRRHPLAADRPVMDGIRHERTLIEGVRAMADAVIDTSEYEAADLRRVIATHVEREGQQLALEVMSFSFKHGVPREADMVFDVRFLKNPYYEEHLSAKSGLDKDVADYIEQDQDSGKFFDGLSGLLLPLLPRYLQEGKHYLTVAIGCTGGQHRSVYMAQKLGAYLQKHRYNVTVRHRDLKGKEA